MQHIDVYTDGSATTADKPGGWGYVILVDGTKHSEGSGHMENATNNDAEMEAVIQGLRAVNKLLFPTPIGVLGAYDPVEIVPPSVTVRSDSRLILGWTSGIYKFKQIDKIAKYRELQLLVKMTNAKTEWVEGHAGHEHNERCDKLANAARMKVQIDLDRKEQKERGETLIGEKKSGILCVWYKGILKVVDLDNNVVENYNRETHGTRGSMWEIKEDKYRERG
jgi:ribonuclease HI